MKYLRSFNEKWRIKKWIIKLGVQRNRPNRMFSVLIKPANKSVLTTRQKNYFREKQNDGRGAGLTVNFVLKNNLTQKTKWHFLDQYDFKSKVDYNAYVKQIKEIKNEYPILFNIIYNFVNDESGITNE